jgi:hypothetical protein
MPTFVSVGYEDNPCEIWGQKDPKRTWAIVVQLKESMCQSHGLGFLGLGFLILTILQHIHSFGCKWFFWFLDIQNPCRMNAIWGLLLVRLAGTMERCSFVIWSHIWTKCSPCVPMKNCRVLHFFWENFMEHLILPLLHEARVEFKSIWVMLCRVRVSWV